MRARVAGAAAVVALALPAAATGTVGIFLPQPTAQLTAEPPLSARAQPLERRFPGRLASSVRVTVDVDRDGRPVSVGAVQRLVISALGDYFFVVPAPVVSVARAPGSEAAPGRRQQGIVWQGFSPGKRVLAATLRLRTAATAPLLPLRVRVVPGGVRVSNATGVPALAYAAPVRPSTMVPILDGLRQTFARGLLPFSASIQAPGTPPTVRMRAQAVFSVRGTLVFRHRRIPFSVRLGPGAERALVVTAKTKERPKVELVATPSMPVELARPPGRSWGEAARRLSGARLLRIAYQAYYAVARGQQYARFLANPDPAGRATASFVYRTAARASVPAAPASTSGGGRSAFVIVLVVLGTVVVLCGLVVLWAHL